MPEMDLRQPGFTYSACGPFTKNKKRVKQFKEAGDSRCIYQNELDKACFQRDMACGDYKDLNRRTATSKVLHDKAFNFAKNPKYDGYFSDKNTFGGTVKNEIIPNKELAEELHKLIIRKFL